jgi:uncharacterized protein YceH (UPF0502 family)
MSTDALPRESASPPRWRPIGAIERRVLGVLVEKAKTTPENYPLSLNALRAGCNQKSNRAPQMQLEEAQIEEALDALRQAGAVLLVQGDSRVDRYRHLAYDWLGVEKAELAVMAELLLRGHQTVGELRGRAARMEPIKDLGELQPILAALEAKNLIVYLTPPGRGSVVTHSLYLDREMEKLRREAPASGGPADGWESESPPQRAASPGRQDGAASTPQSVASSHRPVDATGLAEEVRRLRDVLDSVKCECQTVRAEMNEIAAELRAELGDLHRQLGN